MIRSIVIGSAWRASLLLLAPLPTADFALQLYGGFSGRYGPSSVRVCTAIRSHRRQSGPRSRHFLVEALLVFWGVAPARAL